MTLKNYGKTKKVKKDQEQKKGKEQKKSTLERKLDIPLPLSVIWYIIATSLLFYGLYILGMHFLLKHVVDVYKRQDWGKVMLPFPLPTILRGDRL